MQQQLEKITIDGSEKATQTIIWLHGYGADGYDFVSLIPSLRLAPSTRVILPSAPLRPVQINGNRPIRAWYDIGDLRLDWEDVAGIERSASQLQALGAEELAAGRRLLYVGFSQGGVLALWLGTRTPCNGAIGLSTYLADADHTPPPSDERPLLLMHGHDDKVIPLERGQQARERLQALGYQPRWLSYDMGHQVCPRQVGDLEKHLRQLGF